MIKLYTNWYQLNDNNLWYPVREKYTVADLARLCLGATQARLMPDLSTICICNCANGYKLRLDHHDADIADQIIDVLTPYFVDL